MMKKTTSALAIAALLGTGAASAATFQVNDDTSMTIGGDFQANYTETNDAAGDGKTSFADNGSSLVFAGETVHGNGITTDFYLDFDGYNDLTGDTASTFKTDEYSIGFAGDFGEIRIGAEGDVTGPVFDVADIAEEGGVYMKGAESDRVLQYYSNDLNGVSFAVQAQLNGDDQQTGANTSNTSFSGYVEADLGTFVVGAGYAQRSNSVDEPLMGLMASTSIGGIGLTASYVKDDDKDAESDITALSADYSYGAGSVYGTVQSVSFEAAPTREELLGADDSNKGNAQTDDSFTQYIVGVNYSITSNAYVYGELGAYGADNDEGDYTSVGVVYSW